MLPLELDEKLGALNPMGSARKESKLTTKQAEVKSQNLFRELAYLKRGTGYACAWQVKATVLLNVHFTVNVVASLENVGGLETTGSGPRVKQS
jgi:hypothetical protein